MDSSSLVTTEPKKSLASTVDYFLSLQQKAIEAGASDIFFASGAKPSCKIHGQTVFFDQEPPLEPRMIEEYLQLVMKESDRNALKTDLEHDFAIAISSGHRLRANAFFQKNGLSVAFRIIQNKIPSFEDLGLPEQIKKIVHMPSGLVLVTGSAGSGKSTTLATIVDNINDQYSKHIITIEDPIEYLHENKKSLVEQRGVEVHTKGFNVALRSALRQSPDVLLIGELRDYESISLALTAAETGTLVLATLHTNSIASTVDRIIDTFPAEKQNQVRSQLSQVLRAVIWQKLLPRKDGKGQVAAFEILFGNQAVSTIIRDNKTFQLPSLIQTGQNDDMISLNMMLEYLVEKGDIAEEVAAGTLASYK